MATSVETQQPDAIHAKRVAVVTGGASGIGEAVVRRIAAAANTVVVVADLDLDASQRLAQEIRTAGGQSEAIFLDVSRPESISEFFRSLATTQRRCDVLVNNAGIAVFAPFIDFPFDLWQRTMAVNLSGPFLMAQHAVSLMRPTGWGRIVNVSSISADRASPGRSAYGPSKAALSALTRQMAIELADVGITVNAVAPGPIATPLATGAHSAAARKSFTDHVPMRRYGMPAEVAAAVAFLCSDEACFITGHTLSVDGGFMAAGILDA